MKKYARVLLGMLLITALLTGCGSSAKDQSAAESYNSAAPMAPKEEPMEDEDAIAEEEALEMEYAAGQMDGYGTESGADGVEVKDDPESGQKSDALKGRKLIRSVYMEAETLEFDTFLQDLASRVNGIGGYIERSSVSGNGYNYDRYRYANMTLRIPSEKLDSFITGISEFCNIVYKDESVEDITLRYVDVESRKKALEVEQERLLSLLEKAETVEDIIVIETRLSEVRYELESYGSQLRTYDNKVDYSTVNIDIREVERVTPVAEESVWDRIRNGVGESIYDILRDAKNLVIGFIIDLPYIIVWAIILFLLYKLVKIIYHKVRKRNISEMKEKKCIFRRKNRDVHTVEEEHKE